MPAKKQKQKNMGNYAKENNAEMHKMKGGMMMKDSEMKKKHKKSMK
jgi:hypothetical protein